MYHCLFRRSSAPTLTFTLLVRGSGPPRNGVRFRWLRSRELILLLALMGCDSVTGAPTSEPIIGTPPRQLVVAGPPEVLRIVPDSAFLLFAVTALDSTFHIEWRPTEILIETNRGYRETILLPPHRCLIPRPSLDDIGFPINFTWWSCTGLASTPVSS